MSRGSFVRRYFTSRVSGVAALLLWGGLLAAWLSTQLREWWVGYLQSLSTTFIGIAATVWLLNYFVESENRRIVAELSKSNEQAIVASARRLLRRLRNSLPSGRAPAADEWVQLEWLGRDVAQLQALCDRTNPGVSDERLQAHINSVRLRTDEWSYSVDIFGRLIREVAPEDERITAFDKVRACTTQLEASMRALVDLVDEDDERQSMRNMEVPARQLTAPRQSQGTSA